MTRNYTIKSLQKYYTLSVDVNIENDTWLKAISDLDEQLIKIACHIFESLKLVSYAKNIEFSTILTNNAHIQELNAQYRNKNMPTNCLSFPVTEFYQGDFVNYEYHNGFAILGDVVFSYEKIKSEAIEQKKSFVDHFLHLLVHSILHLLGYDHETEKEALIMENLETEILDFLILNLLMGELKERQRKIMPDDKRETMKPKFPNMLSKLFSFFQCKYHTQKPLNEKVHEDVLDNWSHYKNLKSEDVMVPRSDIVAIDYKADLETITNIFLKTRHTRMPVYQDDLDKIKGFINIKDIFPYFVNKQGNEEFKIDKVIRKMLVISPSMKIMDLLEEMKKTRTHIALVVDAFGGTDGLITIEDLLEEIVGEIEDEHDQAKNEFKEIKPGYFEANGRLEIESLEDKLGIVFNNQEKEHYNTISGLILSISGHVPEKGEKIIHATSGLVFEILDRDLRRIKNVLITRV